MVGSVDERLEPRERAHAVVMTVASDERTVKADFARHPGGNNFELGGEEIVFVDLVGLLKVSDEVGLPGLGLVAIPSSVASERRPYRFLGLRVGRPREDIEIFSGEKLVARLLRLVLAEMGKDVADHEDGVAWRIAHRDVDLRAVLADDRSVERERHHEPLVLLYPAVDVAVEVDVAALLVERPRLEVEARRIGMAADDLEAGFGDFSPADHGSHDGSALVAAVDLVAGLQCLEL